MADEHAAPLSAAEMEQIQERAQNWHHEHSGKWVYAHDVLPLLATLDVLTAERDAYRVVVAAVAGGPLTRDALSFAHCAFCGNVWEDYTHIQHTPDCPVVVARALLANDAPPA